jgi:hypothetical protein
MRDLKTKWLNAMFRLGVQDRDGIAVNDPALDRIAADLDLELQDDELETLAWERANDWHD